MAIGTAAAIIGAGAMAAGASVAGSSAQAKASKKANDTQWAMYLQQREDMAPWREVGERSLRELESVISGGPPDYKQSDLYNLRLKEGQKALDSRAAAMGDFGGGAHQKSLMRYGQELAATDRDRFINEWLNTKVRPLQLQSQIGQSTATNLANAAENYAGAVGDIALRQGNNRQSTYNQLANIGMWGMDQAGFFNNDSSFQKQTPLVTYKNGVGYGVR